MTNAFSRMLNGLVLAGGHSTRMGCDKASLLHPDGRSLARRVYDLLSEAGCEKIVLSLRADQTMPEGFSTENLPEIVRDTIGKSVGPLAGMIAGMRLQPDADWLILACDLPRLDLETLERLLASQTEFDRFLAYRSEFDGLPEPLCTLYGAGSLALLESAFADDLRCPRKILIRNDCRLLDPVSPRALDNANTPEDWNSAIVP
jgi:molybdopterin-guanine dinucleotide biosynthesis protein A